MKKFEILKLLEEYAAQSNCKKKGVASILLKDGEPVNYGINEVMLPTTKRNCELCATRQHESELSLCPAIHAEVACLSTADLAEEGNYSLVVSYSPCYDCCKLIMSLPDITTIYVTEPKSSEIPDNDKRNYGVSTYDEVADILLAGRNYIRLWMMPDDFEVI